MELEPLSVGRMGDVEKTEVRARGLFVGSKSCFSAEKTFLCVPCKDDPATDHAPRDEAVLKTNPVLGAL